MYFFNSTNNRCLMLGLKNINNCLITNWQSFSHTFSIISIIVWILPNNSAVKLQLFVFPLAASDSLLQYNFFYCLCGSLIYYLLPLYMLLYSFYLIVCWNVSCRLLKCSLWGKLEVTSIKQQIKGILLMLYTLSIFI